uniref:Uncharacterized protein n=1 Tax=Cacopsylla melanoneura TaxID=428564 RepID=A0A8D8VQ33_9HEMI
MKSCFPGGIQGTFLECDWNLNFEIQYHSAGIPLVSHINFKFEIPPHTCQMCSNLTCYNKILVFSQLKFTNDQFQPHALRNKIQILFSADLEPPFFPLKK